MIDKALASNDRAERRKLYVEATELITRGVGYIPLHYQLNVWAARAGLKVTPRTDEMTMAMEVKE